MILDGTLPRQRTLEGTLGELARPCKSRRADGSPRSSSSARVAGLRDHLRWFDERPLFGKRVVVTRSREQAGELVEQLEDLGAEAIEAPTIRIAPAGRLRSARRRRARTPATYDWIVFTSANGVDSFMRRLLAGTATSAA